MLLLLAIWAIVKIFIFLAVVAGGVTIFVASRENLADRQQDLLGDLSEYSRRRD